MMIPTPQKILLVEGAQDREVVYHLSNHERIPKNLVEVVDRKGYENLIDTLEVDVKRSGIVQLGIVVDADLDIQARWDSLRSRLLSIGYTHFPSAPDPNGTIIQNGALPKLGFWVMPNNTLPGELEDFAALLIEPDHTLWARAKDCVDQIPAQDRGFPAQDLSKAYIHTWLAWQEEPGVPLGLAITKQYLDANTSTAQRFMQWYRFLFDL